MQNTVIYMCIGFSWLLIIVCVLLMLLSRFKHTQFKQRLLRFVNIVLVFQLLFAGLYLAVEFDRDSQYLKGSYTILIALQITCNFFCYMSVKRRKAKTKPSLDSFSMD